MALAQDFFLRCNDLAQRIGAIQQRLDHPRLNQLHNGLAPNHALDERFAHGHVGLRQPGVLHREYGGRNGIHIDPPGNVVGGSDPHLSGVW